jgi:hypothetical protein
MQLGLQACMHMLNAAALVKGQCLRLKQGEQITKQAQLHQH